MTDIYTISGYVCNARSLLDITAEYSLITAWLQKFSMKHDLPHLNPHAFRHTMASVLINSGQDIVSVSKRLGHAQTSTTLNIYAHVVAEADAKSAECLADVILRPTKKMSG